MALAKKVKYTAENSQIICQFERYRQEMDARNDKFERLVKMSRDITIASKRIIFNLHRILPNTSDHETLLEEAHSKLLLLRPTFSKIAGELEGQDVCRYHRAFTPGLQEFLEAVSFYHVIRHRTLIHPEEVRAEYTGRCPLLVEDYLLGLADLTGEIMRMCISFCSKGEEERGYQLREVLYQVNAALTMLDARAKGMPQKLTVMLQSLRKCELSNYTVGVRTAEFPGSVPLQNME